VFLGQKRFRAEEERIVPGRFLVAVRGENCYAHRECARRLTSRHTRLADRGQRLLVLSQTKTCQRQHLQPHRGRVRAQHRRAKASMILGES